MEVKELQLVKARSSMLVTLAGMVMEVKPMQEVKAAMPMLFKPSEKVTEVMPLQWLKASLPRDATVLGTLTDVRLEQPEKE